LKLNILVQPRASKNAVVGWQGPALKVRLAAPPVDGEANAALLDFLAKEFGLKKRQLALSSGASSRRKVIEILAADEAVFTEKLKTYGIDPTDR
jgi:uncharacterized protein (TIGR00251 family)